MKDRLAQLKEVGVQLYNVFMRQSGAVARPGPVGSLTVLKQRVVL